MSNTSSKTRKPFSVPAGKMTFLVAFLLPVIVYGAIFIGRSIYPGGTSYYLYSDMYHQYAPFLAEFRYKILHHESLNYSWNIGMGTNFASLYAYYCASPLNWLCILVPQSYLVDFMDFMIIFKAGLASLSFTWYASKHTKSDKMTLALFGFFYATSGYWAAYCWNVMWLDCIVLLPLIILGIEVLVNENKCLLYTVSLGLCVVTNYYISIMVILTVIIYFFASLVMYDGPKRFGLYVKKCLHIAFYSMLSAGIGAVILLPELYTYSLSASSSSTFPKFMENYFSFFLMISRQMIDVPVTFGEKFPNVYCGVAVFLLLPLYICAKNIKAKEKIVRCLILLIFLFSFNLNTFDYIWHGMHFPNSLSCRQSFIYIFFMLVMSCDAAVRIREYSGSELKVASGIAIAILFAIEEIYSRATSSYEGTYQYSFKIIYLTLIFVVIYAILLYVWNKNRGPWAAPLMFLTAMIVIIESAVNLDYTGLSKTDRKSFLLDNKAVEAVMKDVRREDSSLFRVDKYTGQITKNDGAWDHYPSISVFSSTANAGITELFGALGLENSMNDYNYNGSTLLTNSIFSVKYIITNKLIKESGFVTYQTGHDGEFVYKNNYTLPIGFMVPSDSETKWHTDGTVSPFESQNTLAKAFAGVEGLFTEEVSYSGNSDYRIIPQTSGHYYAVIKNKNVESATVIINDVQSYQFTDISMGNRVLDCGYATPNDNIEVSADNTMSISFVRMDMEKFKQFYEKMNEHSLNVTRHSTTKIEGTINVSQRGIFFTSIPFDKGWTLKVDGKKVDITAYKDAFISAELTPGEHKITLTYFPRGLALGIFLTLLSIAILVLCTLAKRRFNEGKWKFYAAPLLLQRFASYSDERIRQAAGNKRNTTVIHTEEINREASR